MLKPGNKAMMNYHYYASEQNKEENIDRMAIK